MPHGSLRKSWSAPSGLIQKRTLVRNQILAGVTGKENAGNGSPELQSSSDPPTERGFSGVYLGNVSSDDISIGPECSNTLVELMCELPTVCQLDYEEEKHPERPSVGCEKSLNDKIMKIFVDVKQSRMVMYRVDMSSAVLDTLWFDLARIAYCCTEHSCRPNVLSWIYNQETKHGFGLQCHAIEFDSYKKVAIVAAKIQQAFRTFLNDMESALHSSSLLSQASPDTRTVKHEGIDMILEKY